MSEPAAEPPTPESPPIPTAEPVPSVMDALLDELAATAPADRRDALLVFAKMFLRRLSDEDLESFGPPQLLGRVRSAFAFVDGRGNHPASVRVFVPTLEADGYLVTGTVIETSTDDSPFLVDSVTEELNARDLQRTPPAAPDDRHAARRGRPRRAGPRRARRVASRVGDPHRARATPERTDRADLEGRLRAILHDVRLVIRDFEPMEERVRHMGELARQASVAYSPQEVGETADFIDWLLQLNFVFLGYREYRLADGPDGRTIQAVPGSGLGILSDVSTSSFADATPPGHPRPGGPSPDRGGRAPRHHEDQGLRDGAPARADGLRRGADREPRGRDRRRGAPGRPVHLEGVHGAGRQDAAAAPQARADHHGRGPDPRFARLQGGRRALRVLPS